MSGDSSEPDTDENADATRRGLLRAAAGATVAGAASTAGCLRVSTPANVAAEYEVTGNVAHFVGPGWLAENRDDVVVLDARVPEAYLAAAGSDALDDAHDRHGHLPGAIDVHWVGNVSGRRMTDPGRLVQLYEGDAELSRGGTAVVYGDDNVDPTSTWLTLRAIGFEDVRVYEGGFGEWANTADRGRHPVETATNVVVETEGSVGGDDSSGDFSCTG